MKSSKMNEELTGKRVRCLYRGENIYIMPLFDKDGFLRALDFSQSGVSDNHLTAAGLELVGGLIEKLLAHDGGIEDIKCVCERSSLSKCDLPGIISGILAEYA